MDITQIDKNFKVETNLNLADVKFYSPQEEPFRLLGVALDGDRYTRMPRKEASKVSDGVAWLCSNTAGGRVRFKTDSVYVAVVAEIDRAGKMQHMAFTGSMGFDLSLYEEGRQKHIATFVPSENENYEGVNHLGTKEMRDLTLHLPLYSDVKSIYIGLQEEAVILPPEDFAVELPVVYYGSSITQGGCASRPSSSYPCEPDCIYILGNFDVTTDSKVYNNGFCYQTKGDFSIEKSTTKVIGDLTSQGMWFYRGNVCYDFSFDVEETRKRTILSVEDYNGTMLVLNIGNKRLVSHSCPAKFDISDMVVSGRNKINIQLIGNNRNLLGPHHHINGESYIVCPATFEGEWNELSDLLSPALYNKPTYTDNYGFVPFGINIINIELYN